MTSGELDLYAGRLAKAVETIGYGRLLTLPKPIIEALQGTNDVVAKVKMLEHIAFEMRMGRL